MVRDTCLDVSAKVSRQLGGMIRAWKWREVGGCVLLKQRIWGLGSFVGDVLYKVWLPQLLNDPAAQGSRLI